MTNPTSNFGWQMPTNTDLVTDLPADFEVFGQAVDTSLADLKGGTTGQVLSKNSNTDMDFVWVTDAAGDITGVTAGTGITGGGTSGTVTVSFDQANFGGGQFAAGKNKIINGNFGVWQRGTTFSNPVSGAYTADRFLIGYDGTGATRTISQQTFSPGTAPVAGYEGTFFYRYDKSVAGTGSTFDSFAQRMEDVRLFAAQTVTVSYWAKASKALSLDNFFAQRFGSGGSATVTTAFATQAITTSWVRYTATVSVPSISGKTIGTGSNLDLTFRYLNVNDTFTLDVWGVQVESGSTATPFQTASGSVQGELAMCQRYLPAVIADGSIADLGTGFAYSTTQAYIYIPFKVTPRVKPTGITVSAVGDFGVRNSSASILTSTNVAINTAGTDGSALIVTVASGLVAGNGTTFIKGTTGSILFTGSEL